MSGSLRLCRLCEFPAAEGGVRLADLDAEKWVEWCRRKLGTDLEVDAEEAYALICQFCIWDARFENDEGSLNQNGLNWWTGHDDNHFYREYFFKKSLMQPCKVALEKISSDSGLGSEIIATVTNAISIYPQVNRKAGKLRRAKGDFPCPFCAAILRTKSQLTQHVKICHKTAVRCKSHKCVTFFLTDAEREEHEEKIHVEGESKKQFRCTFCGALFLSCLARLNKHIKKKHKEAIKCDFHQNCPNYFRSESEKNKHVLEVHALGVEFKLAAVKCIYCSRIFKNKYCLRSHVNSSHKEIKIKCRFSGCVLYFLSKKKSDKHFRRVHQPAESLKKLQCPKCSYKTNNKEHCREHLHQVHANKATRKLNFKCSLCKKSFSAKRILNRHLNTVHAEICTCQYCGKAIKKPSLSHHFLSGSCKNSNAKE